MTSYLSGAAIKGVLMTGRGSFGYAALLSIAALLYPVALNGALQDAPAAPAGQTGSPATSTTVFKANVRRVVVDVVVTDSKGQPVPGLTKADFSVAEDGKPQQILSFDANGFNSAMDYLPPNLPAEPANTFVNLPKTPEKGPLYVLLYDLVNMDNEDQMALTVNQHQDQMFGRQQLIKFIQGKPEGSRFAIFVRSDGLHLIQGFTSDKQQLLAAVDPHHPGPHIPQVFLMGQNRGRGDVISAMEVLRYLAEYLDGLPGRKNLIWFSGGFPLTLFPSSQDVPTYAEQVKATLDLVARDQIAIYPVDVRGVVVVDWHATDGDPGGAADSGGPYSARNTGAPGASAAAATKPSAASSLNTGGGISLLSSSYQVEDEIARATGGRAFYSNNDVAGALTGAAETGASYYTIAYAPSNQNYDGRLRRIEVELDKKGYKLAYRRGYFGSGSDTAPAFHLNQVHESKPSTAPPAPRKLGDTLYANMEHGAPIAHQLIFGAHLRTVGPPAMGSVAQMAELATQPAYFKVRKKSAPAKPLPPLELQSYLIDYTVMAHQLQAGEAPLNLELAAAAYDADGKMLNAIVNNGARQTAAETASQASPKAYRAEQQIDVPLAAAWIRVAVRDTNTNRIGAMEIKLPLVPENQTAAAPAKPN
jgi:VWFA-related protein